MFLLFKQIPFVRKAFILVYVQKVFCIVIVFDMADTCPAQAVRVSWFVSPVWGSVQLVGFRNPVP